MATINRDLKILGDFLLENRNDEELAEALSQNINEKTSELIRYVKSSVNEAEEKMSKAEKANKELALADTIKSTEDLFRLKKELEDKIAKNSFTSKEEMVNSILDFAITMKAKAPDRLLFGMGKNGLEKVQKDINAIKKMEEPKKSRTAKMFAFSLFGILDRKMAKKAEEDAKDRQGQTRTIVTQKNDTIVQSMKGKNNSSVARHEVQRIVKQEGNTITRELERIDEMMPNESKAKIYCKLLYDSFVQGYFEGTDKHSRFDATAREILKKEKEITTSASTKSELEINPQERIDWNTLNVFNLMKEIKDYSKGTSKLTLPQIKIVVKKLKQSNYEALELVDTFLSGPEANKSDGGKQTPTRSGQQ